MHRFQMGQYPGFSVLENSEMQKDQDYGSKWEMGDEKAVQRA
jgi:hypothetical protein